MNNHYNIKVTPNVSSFEVRKIKTGLKTSRLINNKSMNNNIIMKSKRQLTSQRPLRLKIEKLNLV